MIDEAKFWARVDVRGPEECWPWLKGKSTGYGVIWSRERGRAVKAHRVAYELTVGPIPDELVIDHTCHNDTDCPGGSSCPHRACQNPVHLEPVEFGENITRGKAGELHRSHTHCVQGHEYTPENTLTQKGRYRMCRECHRQNTADYRARQKAGLPPKSPNRNNQRKAVR